MPPMVEQKFVCDALFFTVNYTKLHKYWGALAPKPKSWLRILTALIRCRVMAESNVNGPF